MHVGEKVITGDWDGQPIWRERTAAEVLAHELEVNLEKKSMDSMEQYDENVMRPSLSEYSRRRDAEERDNFEAND